MTAGGRADLERVIADGALTVPFLQALAFIDVGETAGRQALAQGRLPFRVIRATPKSLRVPVCDLAALLLTPNDSEAEPATGSALATDNGSVERTRSDDDGDTPRRPLRSA